MVQSVLRHPVLLWYLTVKKLNHTYRRRSAIVADSDNQFESPTHGSMHKQGPPQRVLHRDEHMRNAGKYKALRSLIQHYQVKVFHLVTM